MSGRHQLPAALAATPKDAAQSPRTISADSIAEAAAKLVAARVGQGLPSAVEDPALLVRIAELLRVSHVERMILRARGGDVDAA